MNKLIASTLCLLMLIGTNGIQGVKAKESQTTYTGDADKVDSVQDITNEDLKVINYYSKDFMKDDVVTVYYQQGTGINTLNETSFNTDAIPFVRLNDDERICGNKGQFKCSFKVVSNPADSKEFINQPQTFEILTEIKIVDKENNERIYEKKIPAKVVEVEGEVIRTDSERGESYSMLYKDFVFEDVFEAFNNEEVLKVKKFDGTITETKCQNNGVLGSIAPEGYYYSLKHFNYDLRYLADDSKDGLTMLRFIHIYLIDEENNLVDTTGNVVVPFEDREIISYDSNKSDINISAKAGTLPMNSKLVANEVTNINLEKPYLAYDLNVLVYDEKAQPIGQVNLTFKIPENLKNKDISVYYMGENGEFEELENKISGDKITFSTTHFSTYVITEKDNVDKPNGTEENPSKDKPNNSETDDIIKTTGNSLIGDTTMPILLFTLLIVSGGILIVWNKKKALNRK